MHPEYDEIAKQFAATSFEGAEAQLRWNLIQDLLTGGFSMNVVSSNFRTFYLFSKNEFKKLGTVDAIRFSMEISIMTANTTKLDEVVAEDGDSMEGLWHIEAMYQWKDNFYTVGDSLYTITVWSIVTVMVSALLMMERGYNTLMKAWAQAKSRPKKK